MDVKNLPYWTDVSYELYRLPRKTVLYIFCIKIPQYPITYCTIHMRIPIQCVSYYYLLKKINRLIKTLFQEAEPFKCVVNHLTKLWPSSNCLKETQPQSIKARMSKNILRSYFVNLHRCTYLRLILTAPFHSHFICLRVRVRAT